MKIYLIFCLLFGSFPLATNYIETIENETEFNYEEILNDSFETDGLIFSTDGKKDYVVNDFSQLGAKELRRLGSEKDDDWLLTFDLMNKTETIKAMNSLKEYEGIVDVEPDQFGIEFASPSEISNNTNWYVTSANLENAWGLIDYSNVAVAVMDSGIDDNNADLSNRLNNTLSYSASPNSTDPFNPSVAHGTMVAGVIGACGNTTNPAFGVCWNGANIVSLRIDGEDYQENLSCAISAMNYINGLSTSAPKIINFSGGFAYPSTTLKNKINNYSGLFVCAAGNYLTGSLIDNYDTPVYPQYYNLSNMLTVTALNSNEAIKSNACYDPVRVHIGAPGENIITTNMGQNGYISIGDTSAAAPFVAGTAALMKQINPSATTSYIKSTIISTATYNTSLAGKCVSNGKLNAFRAILKILPQHNISSNGNLFTYVNNPALFPGKSHWYRIESRPGTFSFETTGSLNTEGTFYYGDGTTVLTSSNSGGDGNNFKFTYSFTTGAEYFLKVTNNSPYPSNYFVKITPTT